MKRRPCPSRLAWKKKALLASERQRERERERELERASESESDMGKKSISSAAQLQQSLFFLRSHILAFKSWDNKAFVTRRRKNFCPRNLLKVSKNHRIKNYLQRIRLWVPPTTSPRTETLTSGFLKRLGPISLPRVEFPSTSNDYWSQSSNDQQPGFRSASVQVTIESQNLI